MVMAYSALVEVVFARLAGRVGCYRRAFVDGDLSPAACTIKLPGSGNKNTRELTLSFLL